ncbi:MAG: hypothetical protein PF636_01060 [Actinomycetota bacterium]|jgi:hypothetical protein|nr:hypothetical protein [Actinomycetota bacterium]
MPVNIVVGLVALIGALIMYSMGAWGAFRSKSVSRRQVTYLFIGFAFDVLATAMMAIEAGGLDLSPLSDLLHTIVAFVALFGMLGAAVLGNRAIATGNSKTSASVAKWMPAPWAIWVFVFVWGMLSRGSQRLG